MKRKSVYRGQIPHEITGTAEGSGVTSVKFSIDTSALPCRLRRIESACVMGTFTGWELDPEWTLREGEKGILQLEKPVEAVNVPGNSGLPEYKIVLLVKKAFKRKPEKVELASWEREAAAFNNNFMIRITEDDQRHFDSLFRDDRLLTLKKLSDFNLDTREGREEISNVRLVPGTRCLYRGYHPYKLSRPEYETERTRVGLVKEFLEVNDVNSIITLSGEEEPVAGVEEVCPRHQEIRQKGNQLFINTDYSIVYYQSQGEEFAQVICTIVRFINSHPGSYYIHCRLGTDRTGTTSAVLGALCGASWEEICVDYEKTVRMGILENRTRRMIQYCFENFLGHPLSQVKDLQKETASHFMEKGGLKPEEIQLLRERLCANP